MAGHIFISYSRADRPDVKRLGEFLEAAGIPVWYDYELETGEPFWDRIQQEIDECAAVLVALTPEASSSENVRQEMSYAKEQNKPLLPVLLKPSNVPLLLAGLQQQVLADDRRPPDSLIERLRHLIASDAIRRRILEYQEKVGKAVGDMQSRPSHRTANGYYQECDRGAVVWTPHGGAQPIWGKIARCYAQHNGPAGIGFALSPEIRGAQSPQGTHGVYQRFEGLWEYPAKVLDSWRKLGQRGGASIYYSEPYGAHPSYGGIGIVYESLGGTNSQLGFPASDEIDSRSSPKQAWRCFQQFEGGAIFWCEEHDAVLVIGEIWQYLRQHEAVRARLGHPIGPAADVRLPTLTIQVFEKGIVTVRKGLPEVWLKSEL